MHFAGAWLALQLPQRNGRWTLWEGSPKKTRCNLLEENPTEMHAPNLPDGYVCAKIRGTTGKGKHARRPSHNHANHEAAHVHMA